METKYAVKPSYATLTVIQQQELRGWGHEWIPSPLPSGLSEHRCFQLPR